MKLESMGLEIGVYVNGMQTVEKEAFRVLFEEKFMLFWCLERVVWVKLL